MNLSWLWLPGSSQPDFRHTGRKCARTWSKEAPPCIWTQTFTFPLSCFPYPPFFLIFYCKIFVLQYCAGFCHTATRISHTYVSPSWNSLPTPTPSHCSRWSENTGLSSLCHTANSHWLYFIHGNVYVSMPLSHMALVAKKLPVNAGDIRDAGSISGLEDPLEKETATHSCSCLENPMDRGAWWAMAHKVTQSRT